MGKYSEIMKNIELTDEMRERVIRNVMAETSKVTEVSAPKRRAGNPVLLRSLALAAAALLVAGGIFLASRKLRNGKAVVSPTSTEATSSSGIIAQGPDTSGPAGGPMDFSDIASLNQATGSSLSDLKALPFAPSQKSYVVYESGFTEICYTGNETEECIWRISTNASEITAMAENFSVSRDIKLQDGSSFSAFGEEDGMYMAIWNDGTNYHSIQFLQPAGDEVLKGLIEEIRAM
jgi:hypothetical protein